MVLIKTFFILYCLVLFNITAKELPKAVMDILEDDEAELKNYRQPLLELSCKLIVYSKLKSMELDNSIYMYVDKVELKEQFVDFYISEARKYCEKTLTSEQAIFKRELFFEWKEDHNMYVDLNFDQLISDFRGLNHKSDL